MRHLLPQPPNHEEDKEAGASVCIQEVHIIIGTRLVVTLEEEEEEKKNLLVKRVLHFSLALVVTMTCTSTSLANCEVFHSVQMGSYHLIDDCSHCKLLSKSTI